VSSFEDLDRLYATVSAQQGGVDVIVANAGTVELKTIAEVTPEHYDKTFGVNARGTFFLVQKALPLLRDKGSIVLVSSTAHMTGTPPMTVYSASKAAMRSFGRTWAAELKDRGIRVNVISPGPVDTPIVDGLADNEETADAMRSQFAATVPLGRLGKPEELAAAVLFLASDDSSFTTGIDLVVDGGRTQL
jgi:NAD(P)-dependent dehydrogenase (short-subunit alcohol dehydrogenase family)